MTNDRIREIYNRVVPILAVAALVFAVVAVGWSWQNSAADHRQDVQRDKDQDSAAVAQQKATGDNAHLLDCFDRFASQLAGGLPPVREASAARDDARASWENASDAVSKAIEAALERAATGAPVDGSQVPVILGAFHDLDMASVALDKANEHLDKVRTANPYPPPPSEFCAAS